MKDKEVTPDKNEAIKARYLGKRCIIRAKDHPWHNEVGEVKSFEYFSIIGKMGMVIELDNGTDCTVFNGNEVQLLA